MYLKYIDFEIVVFLLYRLDKITGLIFFFILNFHSNS